MCHISRSHPPWTEIPRIVCAILRSTPTIDIHWLILGTLPLILATGASSLLVLQHLPNISTLKNHPTMKILIFLKNPPWNSHFRPWKMEGWKVLSFPKLGPSLFSVGKLAVRFREGSYLPSSSSQRALPEAASIFWTDDPMAVRVLSRGDCGWIPCHWPMGKGGTFKWRLAVNIFRHFSGHWYVDRYAYLNGYANI